jgi:hypothetical protein
LAVDAVLPLEAVVLRATVAFELAPGVAEVVGTAERKLTVERGANVVGRRSGDVTLGPADALDAETSGAVVVASAERNRRIRVRECARSAESTPVADFGRLVAAFIAAAQTHTFDTVGCEVRALTAVDAFAENGLAQIVLTASAAWAVGIRAAEEAAAVVGAGKAGCALKVVLTRFLERRAGVVDAQIAGVTVAVDETGAHSFWSARVSKVALESIAAVEVHRAFRDGRDVTALVCWVAVASDGAVTVG